MKKIFFLPVIISLILIVPFSCKKYLDEKSNAALVVPSTLANFQALMDDGLTMNIASPGMGASASDDFFIENSSLASKTAFEQHFYRWQPYPYYIQNDWSFSYRAVYVPNLCLERLPLVARTTGNETEWDNVKGSALFYKAYYYLELAWLFAKAYDATTADNDLGIVKREGTNFLIPSVRSTVSESYSSILDYAREAASLLPVTAISATRPSKCAAYALLARAFLSMRQYDSAGKYANLSFQLANGLMNYNDAAVVSLTSSNPFKLFNKEVLFHTSMNSALPLYSATAGPARLDTLLFASYHINDLRRKAFFSPAGAYQRFKGTYTGTSSRMFSGIATDEVLLMRAECFARAGDKNAALADLNLLLQHRFAPANFVPVTATTAADALEIVLLERRKELIFRGSLRWMDVKRFNKEGRNILMKRIVNNEVFTLPPNDSRFALQIPQDVIETSSIQQN
jgi:hypothetical protein